MWGGQVEENERVAALALDMNRRAGSMGGRPRVHQGAEEELVDDRAQGRDADERVRAVVDVREAIIADVLAAGPAERQHEPVGRLDGYLGIVDAVDQEQGGVPGLICADGEALR
jgi:hypothetical protein